MCEDLGRFGKGGRTGRSSTPTPASSAPSQAEGSSSPPSANPSLRHVNGGQGWSGSFVREAGPLRERFDKPTKQ